MFEIRKDAPLQCLSLLAYMERFQKLNFPIIIKHDLV